MNFKKFILGLTLSLLAISSANSMYESIPQLDILEGNSVYTDKTVEISEKTLENTLNSLNYLIEELKIAKTAVNNSKTKEEKAKNQSIFLALLRRVTNSFTFLINVADKLSSKKFLIGLIITIGPIVSVYGKYINQDFFPMIFRLLGKKAGEGAVEIALSTSAGLIKGLLIGIYKNIWATAQYTYDSIKSIELNSLKMDLNSFKL